MTLIPNLKYTKITYIFHAGIFFPKVKISQHFSGFVANKMKDNQVFRKQD